MQRAPSPPELTPHERTALWIQAQASLAAQTYADSQPPSPARSSTKTSSSYRNTTSSEETSLKPSLTRTSTSMHHSTHTRAPSASTTQRPRYDSRSRKSSHPFPVSPPGSGYPMPLEVHPPRQQESEGRKTPVPRPPLRKQRRPSLVEQIISIASPGQRRRADSVKKG
ncbi:hypothetical protein C8Q74DRAFT_432021 [Fomes fomentarius]|nr:hypothetical protein C8Q74DRAFT_432021 [Fomes fomentarius]